MFKKVLALTLAAVMLLMPMTASAVTWSTIVAQLKTSPIYSEGELKAEKSGDVTTVKNGEVEFDADIDIDTAGTYVFIDVRSNEQLYADALENDKINIQIKGDSEFSEVMGHAQGENAVVDIRNEATVGTLWGYSLDNGCLNLVNQGKATELGASANKDGYVNVSNQGTVTEDVSILACEGGSAELINAGTAGNVLIHAEGEDSKALGMNESNGVVQGTMNGNAYEGSSVFVVNSGTVEEDFRASAQDASEVTAQNYGTVGAVSMGVAQNSVGKLVLAEDSEVKNGEFWNVVSAYDDSRVSFENNTSIDNLIVGSSDGSVTKIDNTKGSIGKTGVNMVDGIVQFNGMENTTESYVYLEFSEEPTAEQLKKIIAGVGSPEGVYLGRVNADGEWEEYLVTPDGELILIEYEEEEEEDEQEPIPEPDPIELQRQAEGIGGVTTSPVWNWQGYLGHSSKPMWIYVNGEKVLMRQRLFWLGDSTKNHTCRINVAEPDPASIELRVGLDMLRTAQRAEISVISILDKDSNPIAQFAVSDLLGAFEQYGLEEGELLCVSADPDAEVMKVTLDGEYLPLEEAEEENAAA